MKLSVFLDLVARFLFPEKCVFCGKVINQRQQICNSCVAVSVKTDGSACSFCGLPKEYCDCGKHSRFYDSIVCVYLYDDIVKKGVLHYKNGGNKRIADFMAEKMAECFTERSRFKADFITFVPQTKKEIESRGFSQNLEIAEKLSADLNIPLYKGMVKLYETAPQKSVGRMYKQGNIAGIFDLKCPEIIEGKNILLADDVKTSGATLNECAKMLKLYGANNVYCVSFAVAGVKKDINSKE